MSQNGRHAAIGIAPPSLPRLLLFALLIPAALIAALVWLNHEYRNSERVRAQAARSFERRIEQITLLSRLKDAETAQRGYLLTGNPAFLEPYEPARRDVAMRLSRATVQADPDIPRAYVAAVDRLASQKFAELDRTIRLYAEGDKQAALAAVARADGKRLMDELRAVIGRMIVSEATRSAERRDAYLASRAHLQQIMQLVIAALVSVLLLALLWIWRLRQQRHASLVAAFEAAERNSIILDSTVDALLILNPSGTVEGMNAAATRMLGYTSANLEQRDISTVVDIAPGDGSFHANVGLVDGQLRRSFLPDRVVRHHDGREIAADVAMGVMDLPSGLHLVVSLRDISERKRLERVKDDLISTVSHELRTPLTSVVGALGLLRAGASGEVSGEAARLVEIAESNSRRLIRLINDMLDIDRIESGKLHIEQEPVDLCSVLDQACVGSRGLADAQNVTIDGSTPGSPVMVSGDPDRLSQVFANLLSNAIRAAPPGSAVEVAVSTNTEAATVTIDDRGPGIPTAFRNRIFGRFERATPGDGATGTGLGLAISKEIVTRHGGTIWFEDRAGGGTRFAFSLPLLGSAVRGHPQAAAVLVCESDDEVARELIAIVVAEGCAYDLVRSAAEARAALARRRYIAVLVGIALPEEGGIAFAQAARDGEPPVDVPIIVVASIVGDGSAVLDVVDWIDKPADPQRLLHAIRSALARGNPRQPLILHLDDDRDLLEVVAAAIQPEARTVMATDLASARAILQHTSPDIAIIDMKLASGSGFDLVPFLVDEHGVSIPTIIYSAQDVPADVARQVSAVLVKARGSMPDLKATIRRILKVRTPAP